MKIAPELMHYAEVNQAIEDVYLSGGGVIELPVGTYDLGGDVIFDEAVQEFPYRPLPTVELRGMGFGSTILKTHGIFIRRSGSRVSHLQLTQSWRRGIRVEASAASQVLRDVCLHALAVTDTHEAPALTVDRGKGEAVVHLKVTDSIFGCNSLAPIVKVGIGNTTCWFRRCRFQEFAAGVELHDCHGISLDDCVFEANRGEKPYLYLNNTRAVVVRNAWFEDSHPIEDERKTPWFVYVSRGSDAQIHGRFVRRTPRGRVAVFGTEEKGVTCASVSGSLRFVGPWDQQPVVWADARSTVDTSKLAIEEDANQGEFQRMAVKVIS